MNQRIYIASKDYTIQEILEMDNLSHFPNYATEAISFLRSWNSEEKNIISKTSGSTGKPKSITLSKKDMIASAIATGGFFGFKPKAKHFSPLPAQFIAGKMMLVRSIQWETHLHLLPNTSNPLEHCTHMYDFGVMTPHQLSTGFKSESHKNIENINTLLLGGSPVNKELENKIQHVNCSVFLGYGMTETMSHVALRKLNGANKSDSYKAVTGVTFEQDSRDCLVIHCTHLSINTITTNDVVELLSDTEFLWKGRFDFVINSGGIKLFPEEIEQKLDSVINRNFYISGEKTDELGQQLVLHIEGEEIPEMKELLKTVLSKYEVPKNIYYHKVFSYTKTGKILRK